MGKTFLTLMVPILVNKDVFEPSYTDLKFTVQNHNYVWIKLIATAITWKNCVIYNNIRN